MKAVFVDGWGGTIVLLPGSHGTAIPARFGLGVCGFVFGLGGVVFGFSCWAFFRFYLNRF
ncbi:hypothetical protein YC2023_065672 [Brassica napus]